MFRKLPRSLLVSLFGTYAVVLAIMLLVPSGSVPSTGVRGIAGVLARLDLPASWLQPEPFEFAANAAVVVPLIVLGATLFPRLTWRDWTALAFVGSSAVEAVQWLLLPDRSPSTADVVANTTGGLVGGVIAALVVTVRERRRRADMDVDDRDTSGADRATAFFLARTQLRNKADHDAS